jgi:hypothetical protein
MKVFNLDMNAFSAWWGTCGSADKALCHHGPSSNVHAGSDAPLATQDVPAAPLEQPYSTIARFLSGHCSKMSRLDVQDMRIA